ncbi:MAG: penicillin-binding transpeptidase domain-containing protein, partial [Acidimicrobiales bacterium]
MTTHYSPTHHRLQTRERAPRPRSHSTRRLRLVRAGFAGLFALLAVRLVFLQVVDHARYAALSVGQVREDLTTTALRAGIYDRYGQILAVSRPTSLVLADDFQISNPASEARAMSPLVGVAVPKLTALLSEHNGYVVVNNALNLSAGRRVSSLEFPGIVVQSSSVRTYPNGPIATSLLGGTNAQGAGSAGLEYEYQSMLAGHTGITRAFVSSGGVVLPSSHTSVIKRAQPGVGLELTLDTSLQFVTERALAHQLAAADGVTGTAIVMDVKTGEILADASLVNTHANAGVLGPIPGWGKSVGVSGVDQTINNLAFSQAYEPGSVFKVVTFSAALQAGVIKPTSVFAVPNAVTV